jgi:hypothetical protein
MKQTYYSIRTVVATSEAEAIEAVELGYFDKENELCDKVLTKSELIRLLMAQKPTRNYYIEIPKENQRVNKNSSVIYVDNKLGIEWDGGKKLICLYGRGEAIKKARMFNGKARLLVGKPDKNIHLYL